MNVTIAPAKKMATIREGKRVLKRYNFKTVVPFVMQEIEVHTHDYSEWCVSERDGTRKETIKVFCQKTIKELEVKILEYYLKTTQK